MTPSSLMSRPLSAALPVSKNSESDVSISSIRRPSRVSWISTCFCSFASSGMRASRSRSSSPACLSAACASGDGWSDFAFASGRLEIGRRVRRHAFVPTGQDAIRSRVLEHAGIAEVAGDARLDRLALADEPHHQEERHHRGHEVGVGDLPRAAVMAVAVPFFFLTMMTGAFFMGGRSPTRPQPARPAPYPALAVASPSRRSSDARRRGSTRRANSTAIAGGNPL